MTTSNYYFRRSLVAAVRQRQLQRPPCRVLAGIDGARQRQRWVMSSSSFSTVPSIQQPSRWPRGIERNMFAIAPRDGQAPSHPLSRCSCRLLSSVAADESAALSANDPTTTALCSWQALDEPQRQELARLAAQRPTPLRLADMYQYGTRPQRLQNAQFLHKELPIRVAQRAYDLWTLPHGLGKAAPIRQVASIYLGYLRRLQAFPCPQTLEEEQAFTDLCQSLVLDRTSVPISIARGVAEWIQEFPAAQDDADEWEQRLQEMELALVRFFTARVGLRFLTEQYVLSSDRERAKQQLRQATHMVPPDDQDNDFVVGCIQSNCDLYKEITKVADLVVQQTKEYYGGICPKIDIVNCIQDDDQDAKFTYVPHHLHYMVSELLKNSCRATVRHNFLGEELFPKSEQSLQIPHQLLPPIRVVMVKGDEDVTIKIADKGGGIPRSKMCKIFKFAHSTADAEESETEFGTDGVLGARVRGFGLPLARIYARYFGGELTLKSMEGYGLDAYLHLPRLGDSCENLPLRVRSSPGELDSMPTKRHVRYYTTHVQAQPA